jgi:hypothetical protein
MLKPPSTSIEHLAKSFHKVKYIYFVRKIFSSIVFIVLSIFFSHPDYQLSKFSWRVGIVFKETLVSTTIFWIVSIYLF